MIVRRLDDVRVGGVVILSKLSFVEYITVYSQVHVSSSCRANKYRL